VGDDVVASSTGCCPEAACCPLPVVLETTCGLPFRHTGEAQLLPAAGSHNHAGDLASSNTGPHGLQFTAPYAYWDVRPTAGYLLMRPKEVVAVSPPVSLKLPAGVAP